MISQNKWDGLKERMNKIGLVESDIEENFVRSSGHGGQNVNKLNTCVQLMHRPTGIMVRCQISRFQGDNRFLARRILCEKIEAVRLGKASELEKERHRIRAQKRRRSRRAKERILRNKKLHSLKKELRKPPDFLE
jgi:protein subunit release factor B